METDTVALLAPRQSRSGSVNRRHHHYRLYGKSAETEARDFDDEDAVIDGPATSFSQAVSAVSEEEEETSEQSNENSIESHVSVPSSQSSKPLDIETAPVPTRNRSRKPSLLPPVNDTVRPLLQKKLSKASNRPSKVEVHESNHVHRDDMHNEVMSSPAHIPNFPHPLDTHPSSTRPTSRKSSTHNTVPLKTKASFQIPIMSPSSVPNGPLQPAIRKHFLERNTKETKIQVLLSIDGGPLELLPQPESPLRDSRGGRDIPNQHTDTHASQDSPSQTIWIWTGVGFLDHMLHAWAKHAGWSLRLRARGDLESKSAFLLRGHGI